MQKVLSYPLSVICHSLFAIDCIVFHGVQWVCLNLFGYQAHKKSVDALYSCLIANSYLLGTRYKIRNEEKLPTGAPLIIAANHQSLYDIISLGWFMRKVHPKFISKQELGKGIPSISYNLKHGGSVLIDRKNPKQSLSAIKEMAEYIEKHQRTAIIFPEGSRCKTGTNQPRPFAESGLKMLYKYAPSAYIVPVTINNSWKMTRWGFFPLGLGNKIEIIVHDPISVKDTPFPVAFEKTEQSVVGAIR